jgi:hypothetical protein
MLLLVHWSTSYELLLLLFAKLARGLMYPAAPHAAGGCYSSLYWKNHPPWQQLQQS